MNKILYEYRLDKISGENYGYTIPNEPIVFEKGKHYATIQINKGKHVMRNFFDKQ